MQGQLVLTGKVAAASKRNKSDDEESTFIVGH